jgi:hypothetical protein
VQEIPITYDFITEGKFCDHAMAASQYFCILWLHDQRGVDAIKPQAEFLSVFKTATAVAVLNYFPQFFCIYNLEQKLIQQWKWKKQPTQTIHVKQSRSPFPSFIPLHGIYSTLDKRTP